jgi:hypothetical protein
MRLQVYLPTDIAEKLHQLALQELRPIALQAEYMLCRAVQRARCKPDALRQPEPQEVADAPAQQP